MFSFILLSIFLLIRLFFLARICRGGCLNFLVDGVYSCLPKCCVLAPNPLTGCWHLLLTLDTNTVCIFLFSHLRIMSFPDTLRWWGPRRPKWASVASLKTIFSFLLYHTYHFIIFVGTEMPAVCVNFLHYWGRILPTEILVF